MARARRIVGGDRTWRRALDRAEAAAGSDVPVLVTGESGTGKEVVARHLHDCSPRARGPFLGLNVTALPAHLVESELFGYERGAFTGADRKRAGLFQAAGGGTLLIDEIGDLAPELQAKLLRVLQEGEVRPLGSLASVPVDVRVVAATHRDLPALVRAGRFREDLWYRVSVFTIELPPLRDRGRDVIRLARSLLERHGGAGAGARLLPETERLLLRHRWPGNVRELENACRHALVLAAAGGPIRPEHLPASVRRPLPDALPRGGASLAAAREAAELAQIMRALDHAEGNRTRAARRLGVSRQALHARLKRYRIGPATGRPSELRDPPPD